MTDQANDEKSHKGKPPVQPPRKDPLDDSLSENGEGSSVTDNDLDLITTAESSHELYQEFRLSDEEAPASEKSDYGSTTGPVREEKKAGPVKQQVPQKGPVTQSTSPASSENTEWVDDLLSDIILDESASHPIGVKADQADQSPLDEPIITKLNLEIKDEVLPEITDEPLDELSDESLDESGEEPLDELNEEHLLDELPEGPQPAPHVHVPPSIPQPVFMDEPEPGPASPEVEEFFPDDDIESAPLSPTQQAASIQPVPSAPALTSSMENDLADALEKIGTMQLELDEVMNIQTKMMKILRQIEEKLDEPRPLPNWRELFSALFQTKK
ncbi:hypothetical protein JXQ70_14680 [bacterium]|nr:hypothetical protein [bacterium]